MNNEIKEILDKLQKVANCETASRNALMEMEDKDYQLLLDYITNLQEENKRLKELDENYPIEEQLEEALKYENIYKARIDKAIEYFKYQLEQLDFYKDTKARMLCAMGIVLLQGEDKNE